MGFQDMVAADRNIFIDFEFFGETHMIEGAPVVIVFDDDTLKERQGSQEMTIAESTMLFHAKSEDMPPKLAPGKTLSFDGKECLVDDVEENMGIVTVAMRQNRTP